MNKAHVSAHAQSPILGQTLGSNLEYHFSTYHRGTTIDREENSHVADDFLHMPQHDCFGPAVAGGSPTLPRAHTRGSSDTTRQSMTASPTFGNTGFAGVSTNMFYPADPMSYSEQPMGPIGCKNPIKLEDDQASGWYDRFSTGAGPATHVQVFGSYPPYPLPGQVSDLHAETQYMHTWPDLNDPKNRNQMALPMEGTDRGWISHQARSEMFPGMNSHHPANTEWSSAWIYHGC